MKNSVIIIIVFMIVTSAFIEISARQDSVDASIERDEIDKSYSIGSSLFLLGNLAPGDPPYFFLINFSYQLGHRDIIFSEAITWTYYEPLGTYGSSNVKYPGKISAYGLGFGYQRFLWKNLFVTAQATPFYQQFYDEENKHIQNGFQLYLQSRIGYRFEFFDKTWFIEPSVSFNYWPVNTNFPESFEEVENGNPNYFLFEPGLHFGYRF